MTQKTTKKPSDSRAAKSSDDLSEDAKPIFYEREERDFHARKHGNVRDTDSATSQDLATQEPEGILYSLLNHLFK